MNDGPKTAIMHVALNPYTGAWSVMRDLAAAQRERGTYAGVALGVIADARWPSEYREQLSANVDHHFLATCPHMFGTASFIYQYLRRPGIEKWVDRLAADTGAERVIVHFHNAWMTGVFLPLKRTQVSTHCVATFHGVNAEFGGQPVRARLHRWMARRLLQVPVTLTSVDAANLTRALAFFGLPENRFTVVPNGVRDTDARGCTYASRGKPLVVGHVGTLSERKGWRIGADAVKQSVAAGRDVRFIIAGRGPDEASAREFAEAHSDFVEYRGFVSNPRETVFPELDIMTAMSVHEGLPMSIIEAMSVGIPSVATAVGGVPEAITDGLNGHLISRDPASLSAILCALYDDSERLQALSREARKVFEDRFEISRILDTYDTVYEQA